MILRYCCSAPAASPAHSQSHPARSRSSGSSDSRSAFWRPRPASLRSQFRRFLPGLVTLQRYRGVSVALPKSNTTSSADFAIVLAEEFRKRFPPGAAVDGASAKAFARMVDDLCARAQSFQRDSDLGLYGKAKFGTEFKYRLKDLGYPEALVDELTRTLLLRMSAK